MECILRSNSLLVFFFLLSFAIVTLSSSSSVDNNNNDDIVYDIDGNPLQTNTLYYASRQDGNWVHTISYSPNHYGFLQFPLPIVESSDPIVSFGGAPIMFHSLDPATTWLPTINITTQTPLTITFLGGWFRWFADASTNSRFLMSELAIHSPSFFIKRSSNNGHEYNIAFEDRHYVKLERDNISGLKHLAATGDHTDSDLLQIRFSNTHQCLNNGNSLGSVLKQASSTSNAFPAASI